MTRLFVFDLDDTLYLERDYVRSGFSACAAFAAAHLGKADFFDDCWSLFLSGQRGDVFDVALTNAGLSAEPALVRSLVETYRSHIPQISLLRDAATLLSSLSLRGVPTALVSDGPLVAQRNKVVALGLDRAIASIRLTDEWGRDFWKPHPRAFESVASATGIAHADCVYIADNPHKDFLAPKSLGWRTIRVRRELGEHFKAEPPSAAHAPDLEVATLSDVRLLSALGLDRPPGGAFSAPPAEPRLSTGPEVRKT